MDPSQRAAAMEADRKSRLAEFLQRYVGRTLRKGDVVYTTVEVVEGSGAWQSHVQLVCCAGDEGQVSYAGEVVADSRAAEHSAAAQVLAAYAYEIANLPPPDPSKKRQAAGQAAGEAAATSAFALAPRAAAAPSGPENEKTQLTQALQAHCKRALAKDDVVYTMTNYGGPYQATVRLALLGEQEFCGAQCADEKAAGRAAAAVALASQAVWAPYVGPPASQPAKAGTKRALPTAPLSLLPPPQMMTTPMVWQIPGRPPLTVKKPMARGWPAAVVKPLAAAAQSLDSKTQLCQFLQAKLQRAMTKADVVYTSVEVPGAASASLLGDAPAAAQQGDEKVYASMVVLGCLGGAQHHGNPTQGRKAAEQAAAKAALAAYAHERSALPAPKRQRLTA